MEETFQRRDEIDNLARSAVYQERGSNEGLIPIFE
jgi:hypothetical protein